MEPTTYFDINELAIYLRSTVSTLYKKTHRHEIPFVKNGGKLLFRRDRIDEWLAGNATSNKVRGK